MTTVIANGQITGNPWTLQTNDALLFVDGVTAQSNASQGAASDIIVGNFQNLQVPQDAIITGIEFKVWAKRGEQTVPPIALSFQAVDNTSGTDAFYPYISPFTGLTTDIVEYLFGGQNYLFATSWTPDQINNFKLALIANGDIAVDAVYANIYYYIPSNTPIPPPVTTGCEDCDGIIQVQQMELELDFLVNETKFYLKKGSFAYPDGTPVQPGDIGICGGEINWVFDEAQRKIQGSNFEENVVTPIDPDDLAASATFTVLASGVIEVDIKTIQNRGIEFKPPYGHDPLLMSNHSANSAVIISNSARFYGRRFVRVCQEGVVYSAPIQTLQNGTLKVPYTKKNNFKGGGVQVQQDPFDPNEANIIIPGFLTAPPIVTATTSATSGNVQVGSLSADLEITGLNRGTVIQISTEQSKTITSVTVGGVAATQEEVATDVGNNLREETWVCVNPPLGTQPVVVTLSGNAYLTFGAEALTEVDTSNPVGNTQNATGNNNNPTLALTTANDNSLVFDGLCTAQTPILYTPGTAQVENWHQTANAVTRQGGSSYEPAGMAPDIITMDYAITQSTPWAYTAVEINGIPATTPVISGVTVQDESGAVSVPNVVKIVTPDGHVANPAAGEADISFQNIESLIVNQTGHGFSDDDNVRSSGVDGEYTFAQADVAAHAESVGVVKKIDNDNFIVFTEGYVVLSALPGGAVTGNVLYLDDATPGAFTLTPPSAPTTIVKKLAVVIDDSTNLVYYHNYLGLTQAQYAGNTSGGNSSMLNANQFLGIAFSGANGSGFYGIAPEGYILTDTATKRIYVPFGQTTPMLRFFKNDYGSFYKEKEITITAAMLTQAGGTIQAVTWCKDANFIYAIVQYRKTTSVSYGAVDVVRFNIDGTGAVATNIDLGPSSNNELISWTFGTQASCVVGTSFFVTWRHYNGATYVNQFREYDIAGTVYTLINTYTVSAGTADEFNAYSLSFDSNTSFFYLFAAGGGPSSTQLTISKWNIVGSVFIGVSNINYDEFAYGNDFSVSSGNVETSQGYNIANVDLFTGTTYTIYLIQKIKDSSLSSNPVSGTYNKTAYWLTAVTYPLA